MFLFLLASGLSLIFGVSRTLNLAHGSLYMLAAYLSFTFTHMGAHNLWGFVAAIAASAVIVMGVGTVMEVTVLRRVYESGELYIALVTYAVILLVESLVKYVWGSGLLSVPLPDFLNNNVLVFGVPVPRYNLILIALGIVVAVCLWRLIYHTRWGLNLRAAAMDREMAAALGLNEKRLFTTVFLLGSLLAGLGGALAAPLISLDPSMDANIIIQVFAVVVIGGLGSLVGSLVAALLVGILEAFGVLAFPGLSLSLVFIVMAVVLIVRPWGLFGREEA